MNRYWTAPQKRFFRLLLFVFLLLAGGIAAAGYSGYRNNLERLRSQTESQLASIAALKTGELQVWRSERLTDAAFFHRNREFAGSVESYLKTPNSGTKANLLAWLEKARFSPEYSRVFLLDPQGGEILSAPLPSESVPPELAAQVTESLKTGEPAFLDFHKHSNSSKIYLSTIIPVFDAHDKPLGALVLQIDPEKYLYPFIQRWTLPSRSGETLLIRREEKEALYLNRLRFDENAALNLRIPLERTESPAVNAALGREGFTEGVDYRGVEVFAEIRAVPNSPWYLVAKIDKSEAYAPMKERLRQEVVYLSLLIASAGAALALLWRKQEADQYRSQIETLNALRASEEKFRLAFDTNPDAVSISRLRDGMFISVNKGFERISGYSRAEVVGKTSTELNLWKDSQERQNVVEKLLAEKRVENFEAVFLARSEEIHGLLSAALIELDGEPHILNIVHDISNRKRSEEALRQAEEKYRGIFENSIDGIFQSLPDGRFVNVNPAFARMLGYESPAELLETVTNIAEQTYVDKERRAEFMRLMREQGAAAGFEFKMKRKDGAVIWVRENARAVRDPQGNLLYYEGAAEDITERKRIEEALVESEKKMRALVEQAPAIVYTEAADSRETIFISPQVEKVTGYSAAEWTADPGLWKSIIHPEDLPTVLETDERTHQTLEPYQAEYRILTKDGRIRWLHDEAVLIRNEEDKPLFWQGAMYDITERKEAEEQIRRLSRAVEQSPASIVITNALGNIEYANPAFSELTGYSLAEAKDKTPRILKSGYTSEEEYKELWDVITSGRIWRGEFLNKKKNGETYWESAVIAPVFNEEGKIINFVGVKQDITERKQAEKNLENARQFLQNVQDSLSAHIAILDNEGNIVQVNAAWREFGRRNGLADLNGCVGVNYLKACDKGIQDGAEGAAEAAGAIREALSGEKERAWFEYPCHSSNEKRWYVARISSFNNSGQRWVVVSHDNITARKQAEESVRQRAAELELLYENSMALAQSLDQRQIARRLIELLSEKLDWHHTAIRLLNQEDDTLELAAFDLPKDNLSNEEHQKQRLKKLRKGEGLSGWALQQSKPIRLGDVSKDPHYIESYPGICSGLYVPLKMGDRALGVISVESEKADAFSEADEQFIVTLANQAAVSLENARLYKEVSAHAEELEKRVRERTAEIELTKQRLELAVKTAGIGIWEWDIASDAETWDDRVFELHGLDKNKVTPSPAVWRKVVHPEDLPAQQARMEKVLSENRPYSGEYRVILPGGEIRHLKTSGIVIRDEEGVPLRLLGADQDITLHKQAEESLLRANAEMLRSLRMKTEFLATMSHELRTPLNSILGISESLEEQIAGALNEKQLKYVRTIRESGRHLLELINDILDLSRIEAGKLDLDIQNVSVQKLCAASLRMIKELAQKKSLNVSFKMDEKAQTFRGDERRLKQILVNLLGNAVKFTPEGREIGLEVKANLQTHEILFTVWDRGIGIAEEERERLFQPFVQLKSGLAREYGGSGLGLALVAQMARLHNGRVSVESKVNEGSRFTVALPWQEEESAKASLPPVSQEIPQRSSGGVVLIVEDTEVVAQLISDYLRHKGYRTFIAANGREGVLLAKQKRPQIILMDVMMPVMNGLEAAASIRADPDLRDTPIIGLTALAMPSDREQCLRAGMNDHVPKPVQMQELLKIIERYLHHSE